MNIKPLTQEELQEIADKVKAYMHNPCPMNAIPESEVFYATSRKVAFVAYAKEHNVIPVNIVVFSTCP